MDKVSKLFYHWWLASLDNWWSSCRVWFSVLTSLDLCSSWMRRYSCYEILNYIALLCSYTRSFSNHITYATVKARILYSIFFIDIFNLKLNSKIVCARILTVLRCFCSSFLFYFCSLGRRAHSSWVQTWRELSYV